MIIDVVECENLKSYSEANDHFENLCLTNDVRKIHGFMNRIVRLQDENQIHFISLVIFEHQKSYSDYSKNSILKLDHGNRMGKIFWTI